MARGQPCTGGFSVRAVLILCGWARQWKGAGYDGECGSTVRRSYRWWGAVHGAGRSWGRTHRREGGPVWHGMSRCPKGASDTPWWRWRPGAGGRRGEEGLGGADWMKAWEGGGDLKDTHTHIHSGKSVLLYGGKSVLFNESEPQPFFFLLHFTVLFYETKL